MADRAASGARLAAYKILERVYQDGAYSNLALREVLSRMPLTAPDRALAAAIAYGCIQEQLYLDYVIDLFSSVKLKKLSVPVLLILRIGVFQILKLDRVPDSAAVDECVRLAAKLAYRSKGFVNGVLRSVARAKEAIRLPEDALEGLSVFYSFPKPLVQYFDEQYGTERTAQLVQAFAAPPKLHVRVNTLRTTVDAVKAELAAAGVSVKTGDFDDDLYLSGADITALDAYKNGLITAQGVGSMTAVRALDAQQGMTVLDLCAAPGGKSVYIAQRAQDACTLQAFDIHEHKIRLIEETAARLGITSIRTACGDAAKTMEAFVNKADRVLVDAPCSGLGIIAKKPDIKYAWSMEKTNALARLQQDILHACAPYVKAGGVLVYSTCTLGEQENLQVVRAFLQAHTAFALCDMTEALPKRLHKESAREGYAEFFPDTDGTDGFFVCKMRRK